MIVAKYINAILQDSFKNHIMIQIHDHIDGERTDLKMLKLKTCMQFPFFCT